MAVLLHPLGALLTLVIATVAVYSPALGGEFLWDDNPLVKGNGLIRSPLFFLEAFRHTLFDDESNFYRPVQTLTYFFDYWRWGLDPFGYHLTNALLHALNGCLLFALLRRTLPALIPPWNDSSTTVPARPAPTDWLAFTLAWVWTLHPIHNAAVAYISGRADSLAMCFCLLAWLLCSHALESPRPLARAGWAVGAFAALLAGLCSKEIAFVWMILFGGWLFALRPSFAGQSAPRELPLRTRFAVSAAGLLALCLYLGLRQLPHASSLPPASPLADTPAKWALMLRALGDYGRMIFFPHRLFMNREVFAAPGLENPASPAFYNALAIGGAFQLAAFALGICLPGRGRTLRRAGAAWFLVGFLPISNLFSLNASVAEHWMYLPSIGFLLFLAGVAFDVPWGRLPAKFRAPHVAVSIFLVIVAALGLRTWLRAHDWTTALAFYQQTIRDGGDVPRAREGLAQAYRERAQATHDPADDLRATGLFQSVADRYPTAFTARVNLATLLARQRRTDEARSRLEGVSNDLLTSTNRRAGPREFALTIHSLDLLEPPAAPAWTERRRALLERATERFPNSWELTQIRIADREKAHDLAGALEIATTYHDARWWHAPAQFAVGRLLALNGRTDDALTAWTQTARLDIRDADTFAAAAVLCLKNGRGAEAVAFQERAVHRRPDSPRQHVVLAEILESAGRNADAAREREMAAALLKSGEQ